MRMLDENTAVAAGGWDARWAKVLAVATHEDVGAAIIDTNGDGGDVDLDWYERIDGEWQPGCSGNISDTGSSESPTGSAQWGRGAPGLETQIQHRGSPRTVSVADTGWWLFVTSKGA